MTDDPTQDYVFLAPDICETPAGEVMWPFVRLDDTQDLDWWGGEPVAPGKPVDFSADPEYANDVETFELFRVAVVQSFPLLRPAVARVLRPFMPSSAQLIPSYIKTGRGRYEWDEDWVYLHLWDMIDVVDRERSEETMLDGEPFGTFDSIRLSRDALNDLRPDERSIIRLSAEDEDLLIFHRTVGDALLAQGIAGALVVPLAFYAPAMTFLRDHRSEIDRINGAL